MKSKNLLESFNNAINGILFAIRHERNMRIHMAAVLLVVLLGIIFRISRTEMLIVCLAAAFVIVCELFNTAIEKLMDIIVDVYHPKAKTVKDLSAGAVLVSSFVSLIVAYFVFFDKAGGELENGLRRIEQSPWYITVIAILVTIMLVLLIKAFLKKGTPLRGGMPSGHSAIAFSITTAVSIWTNDARIAFLCLLLSLLLVQSRLERKIHSIPELAAGALLGFLVTLLLFQISYSVL